MDLVGVSDQNVNAFYGLGGRLFAPAPSLLSKLPLGSDYNARIHFGRLTNDPYPDFIYRYNATHLLISLNRNGVYATPVPLIYSTEPNEYMNDATLADINGDGFSELILGQYQIKTLLCDGNGGFSLDTAVTSYSNRSCSDLIVADVNKDGYPDVVARDWFSAAISVFRQNLPGDATLNGNLAISYLFDSRDFTFTFRNAFSPNVTITQTLDPGGNFTIDGLKAQGYILHIVGPGFAGRNFNLDLGTGGTVTLSTALPMWCGDINGDNAIDFGDLSELLQSYNALVGDDIYVLARDLNGDGGIDFGDLSTMLQNYNIIGDD